jgi:hypothetical protein
MKPGPQNKQHQWTRERPMRHALRVGIVMMLGALAVACASPKYENPPGARADVAVLRALRLQPGDIRYQAPCVVTFETEDLAAVSCVYVQTATHLHFLRYSGSMGEYVPVIGVPIADVTRVALAKSGSGRQIQVSRGEEFVTFHIVGPSRALLTEEIYSSLTAAGVAQAEPRKWVDLSGALPVKSLVPAYVSR